MSKAFTREHESEAVRRPSQKRYVVGHRVFGTLKQACAHARAVFDRTGIVVAITER